MTWLIFHLAGGSAFFSGAAAFTLGVAALAAARRRWARAAGYAAALVGIALVAACAVPLPAWAYAGWGCVAVGCLALGYRRQDRRWLRVGPAAAAVLVTLAAVAAELPYHLPPSVPAALLPRLYVVGDSVSAGVGADNSSAWPAIVRAEHGVEVINFSRPGATAADALRRLEGEELGPGLVLLEIGGNDVLGRKPPAAFEADLERLLARVGGPNRVLVMLELPLLPLDNAYGAAQRRAAGRHGVVLVPRRYFASVLAGEGNTTDGVHLTAQGQRRMAEALWELLGGALEGAPP